MSQMNNRMINVENYMKESATVFDTRILDVEKAQVKLDNRFTD